LKELQLTIRSLDGSSLGDSGAVQAELTALFPATAWAWTSAGADRLAVADAAGQALPLSVRRALESQPSMLCGESDEDGLAATFNLGPGGPVPVIWATLGGEGSAVEAGLARLSGQTGWSIGPGQGWFVAGA
jgi:hypothetical protein